MPESDTIRFERAVASTITRHNLIGNGEAVLAGVSGGPDSTALLHVLQRLAPDRGWRLGVAHLNHGLRGNDAASDEAFVEQMAATMGLPYYAAKEDVPAFRRAHGLSVEEAARKVRYRFLARTAATNGYGTVALGHHADDNGELVLMNLLRGSGPLGLSGMPMIRPLQIPGESGKHIQLVRPLLSIRRDTLLAYLGENGISSVTDPTNTDMRYRRNRIRRKLIPLLQQSYNPNIIDALNRLAEIIRSEEEWTDHLSASDFNDTLLSESGDRITLSLGDIRLRHPAARRRILRHAIRHVKGELRRIEFIHIDAVMDLISQSTPSGSLDLPDRIRVEKEGEKLFFIKSDRPLRKLHPRMTATPETSEYFMKAPGVIVIPEFGIEVRSRVLPRDSIADFRNAGQETAFFDMDAVSFPMIMRSVKPGDRFAPLGTAGKQKVKKYFIDHKIPVSQRASCPVLVSREKIIWLMGHRIDESVKITPRTRKVLKVELAGCLKK